MSTFLFDKIVFGPVKSRRLGVSLGINLSPVDHKLCNFDCVYCECGLNTTGIGNGHMPQRKEVSEALELKLAEMRLANEAPDVITFAGNGEPTMHPEFAAIINDSLALRNKYFPSAKVSVLSNSTMLHKATVVEALKKVDQNILKLDSGLLSTILALNKPTGLYSVEKVVSQLKEFKQNLIIQTMFTRGKINGIAIDNTTEADITAWLNIIVDVNPQMVMIYTVDRDTPFEGLQKIGRNELETIAQRVQALGIETQVSA
ncbi:MAG TPA: radical SAM protein [Bacteroidales bacterium]|nr:radical SAM protein [Bacteroidales bacterium]